jgi:predicted helicase
MADDWKDQLPLFPSDESSIASFSIGGIQTNRDSWMYNTNESELRRNVGVLCRTYNSEVAEALTFQSKTDPTNFDPRLISWSEKLLRLWSNRKLIVLDNAPIGYVQYRPFYSTKILYEELLIDRLQRNNVAYPELKHGTISIGLNGVGSEKPFTTCATRMAPDRAFLGSGTSWQAIPFTFFDPESRRLKDNVTDWGLEQFQSHYKDTSITKLDIFHYVYGILHDPAYRTKYAANLKRELPRIPFAENFWKVAETGKRLMDIHVHYEDQPEFALHEEWSLPKGYVHPYGLAVTSFDQVPERDRYRVTKMKRDKKDPTRLIVNDFLTLTGIPANVDDYKLGNRSALDWIIDQYQVSTDKRSGITNDPNREDDPTYIIRLIKKVVTVSVETVGLVLGVRF